MNALRLIKIALALSIAAFAVAGTWVSFAVRRLPGVAGLPGALTEIEALAEVA